MAVLSVALRGGQCDPWSLGFSQEGAHLDKARGLVFFDPLCCYKFIVFRVLVSCVNKGNPICSS